MERCLRVRAGFKKIRLPGERGFAALKNCKLRGVPPDDNKLQILKEIADDNGIEIWFKSIVAFRTENRKVSSLIKLIQTNYQSRAK